MLFVNDSFKLSHKDYSLWFLLSLFAVNFFPPHLFSTEETLCENAFFFSFCLFFIASYRCQKRHQSYRLLAI